MVHRFHRREMAARAFAWVLVALLFGIAVLAAIYRGCNDSERTACCRATIERRCSVADGNDWPSKEAVRDHHGRRT
jgi:hypothetical protein